MGIKNTEDGAAVYSPLVLSLYDLWVLKISNTFFWKCPTKKVLLPFFEKNLSTRHLDVGVGTGYYLKNSSLSSNDNVTLMDLNEHSLAATEQRLAPLVVRTIHHDITQELPNVDGAKYDSISLFYLLHCLPGDMNAKSTVFNNLKKVLSESGIIYGATILGDEAGHNYGGRKLMDIYNKKGIFGNRNDSLDGLTAALKANFKEVMVKRHGQVALFEAKGIIA